MCIVVYSLLVGFEQKLAHLVGPGHMAYLWPTHGLPSKAKNRNIGSIKINYRPENDNSDYIRLYDDTNKMYYDNYVLTPIVSIKTKQ